MRSAAITLMALSLVVACGGDGSPRESPGVGGNAGAPADGGSAGMAVGGSGMTAGAGGHGMGVLRGAVSLHVQSPPGCSLAEHHQDFPQTASGHPVTADQKIETVEDGAVTAAGEQIAVICDLLGSTPPYSFRGRIQIGSLVDYRMVEVGGPMTPGDTTVGGLVLISPELPSQYGSVSEDPCSYEVIALDETTRSIWGRVTCDVLSPSEGMDACAVGPSFFFFENCTPPT